MADSPVDARKEPAARRNRGARLDIQDGVVAVVADAERALAGVVGTDELSRADKASLAFGDSFERLFVNQGMVVEHHGKPGQFFAARQLAVDEQIGDLGETRFGRQLFDRISTISQDALFTVKVGDGTFTGSGIEVAVVEGDSACLLPQI